MAHIRFIGFQIDGLSAGLADQLAQFQIMVEFFFDVCDIGLTVPGPFQFIGNIGKGAHQRRGGLVEGGALRLAFL